MLLISLTSLQNNCQIKILHSKTNLGFILKLCYLLFNLVRRKKKSLAFCMRIFVSQQEQSGGTHI